MRSRFWQKCLVASMLLMLAGCSPIVDTRGHVDPPDALSKIKPGQSKDDILQLMGSPSSISNFGSENWYYISSRKENVAFLAPKIVDQHIIQVEFDQEGTVKTVQTYNKDNAKEVGMVSRVTPTEGHSLGVAEQLLGNLGRFNKKGGKRVGPRGPVPGRPGY